MKYTKQQLDLIVTNVYNQICIPIELENKEILDKQEIEEDEVLTDIKLYNQYQDTINSLYKQKDLILKKHQGDDCKFFMKLMECLIIF